MNDETNSSKANSSFTVSSLSSSSESSSDGLDESLKLKKSVTRDDPKKFNDSTSEDDIPLKAKNTKSISNIKQSTKIDNDAKQSSHSSDEETLAVSVRKTSNEKISCLLYTSPSPRDRG